jgi:hypothetical protein
MANFFRHIAFRANAGIVISANTGKSLLITKRRFALHPKTCKR